MTSPAGASPGTASVWPHTPPAPGPPPPRARPPPPPPPRAAGGAPAFRRGGRSPDALPPILRGADPAVAQGRGAAGDSSAGRPQQLRLGGAHGAELCDGRRQLHGAGASPRRPAGRAHGVAARRLRPCGQAAARGRARAVRHADHRQPARGCRAGDDSGRDGRVPAGLAARRGRRRRAARDAVAVGDRAVGAGARERRRRRLTRERYTSYPRPVLWLVPEGELEGAGRSGEIAPFYPRTGPGPTRQRGASPGARERAREARGADDPAIGVDLALARSYCERYARIARKAIRLPTEVEWEHACRAGSRGRWFWGDDAREADAWAWHRGNSGDSVPPLAAKRSNGFGLHAMLGGVWEWVEGDDGAVLGGGSWRTALPDIGCGVRRVVAIGERVGDAGFRIARSLRG